MKLNVDASVHFDLQAAAVGGLIQDSFGLCSAALTANVGFYSPLFVEIWSMV